MEPESSELHPDVVRFIEERIDTVPHLEAVLLLWESAPESWAAHQTAARLYVSSEAASSILDDLVQRDLARASTVGGRVYYRYECPWDPGGDLLRRVAATYRRQTVRVSSLIHSKAPTAVRDFARAFRLRDKE